MIMGSWHPGTAEILGIILVICVLVIIFWAFASIWKKLKSKSEGSKG